MSDREGITSPKKQCVPCPVILVVGLVAMVFAYGGIVMVVEKVLAGGALEHCCTIEGVRFNYLGVFTLICGLAFALAIAAVLQLRDWLIRRDLGKRYGVRVLASEKDDGGYPTSSSTGSFDGSDYGDGGD